MLDPTLCDALFKGVLRKGDIYATHMLKAGAYTRSRFRST
jgi:hypothetical protein